jgi:hypothetical protein
MSTMLRKEHRRDARRERWSALKTAIAREETAALQVAYR